MINFLLKKHTTKLEILLRLSNHEKITFSSLLATFQLPRTTLKRTLTTLKEDLLTLNLDCDLDQDEFGHYFLIVAENSSALTVYQTLKLVYLKESAHFNLLSLVLSSETRYINKIIEQLAISKSYFYQLTTDLNLWLAEYQLSMEINPKEATIALLGHEPTIRMFSFILLNESYQSLEWPFKLISKEDINASLSTINQQKIKELSSSQKNQVFFLVAITKLRIQKGKVVDKLDDTMVPIIEIIRDHNDLTLLGPWINQPAINNQEVFNNENLFFNMILRIFVPNLFSVEQKRTLGTKLTQSELPFLKDLRLLAHHFAHEFGISPGALSIDEIVYYLAIYKIFLNLLRIQLATLLATSYKYPEYFPEQDNDLFLEIKNFYADFLSSNPKLSYSANSKMNFVFTCLILFLLTDIAKQTPIKLYIQYSKNFLGERFLTSKIKRTFSSSTLQITDHFEQANIIISDLMEPQVPNKKYFYIYDMNSERQWTELVFFITKYILVNENQGYAAHF